MSDDLDKMASELKNMKPSDPSRKGGMAAAMAAFDTEFTPDKAVEKTISAEKLSQTSQGLSIDPHPTGRSAHVERALTLGQTAMTKLSHIFDIKPRTAMMGGSCMAAFIACFVVFQSNPFQDFPRSEDGAPIISLDTDGQTSVKSNIVTLERRVAKTPARTVERIIPSVTKMETRRVKQADGSFKTMQAPIIVQEATTELVTVPPVYEIVRETVQIEADGSSSVLKTETVPPALQAPSSQGITSVDGLLSQIKTQGSPVAEFESQKIALDPRARIRNRGNHSDLAADSKALPTLNYAAPVPSAALTVQVPRRVISTPASVTERLVPAVTKDVSVQVKTENGSYKTVTKTFVVQEAYTEIVSSPVQYETVMETVVLTPEDFVAAQAPINRNQFENYESNPVTSVDESPVSTFSVDVDTSSYSFLRTSLNRGQIPPAGTIRLEEMINYFPYDYAAPTSPNEPFKANVTVTPTPWNADTKLMHIGIKGYVPPTKDRPQSNLVFLIDTSGSMNQANKLPLLINSFKLLLNTLDEDDTVSIVTYAGRAGTVLEPTPASDKKAIKSALDRLRAGGSTAGAEGLALAYQKAEENFKDDGVNRIILATDGDFNIGFSSPEEMKTFIKEKRETGVFLSVLGFGNENYNDQLMQSIAQNGNGTTAYIDTLSEANKVLANEAGSALITIAKDVKIQVEFNPATISEYRLIGYETRSLKREDFNNDKVDAGDIGAGHSVTAIYELTPVDSPAKVFDPLRYVKEGFKTKSGSNEFAFVKIRHKLPNSDSSTLQTFPISQKQERSLKRASDDVRFAAALAAVGQKLRGQTQVSDFSYEDTIELASGAKGEDKHGYRAEFIQLVRLMKSLEE